MPALELHYSGGLITHSDRDPVYSGLGDSGQLLVGRLLLVQVLLQDACAVVAPQLPGPRCQRAVPGDLLMLHRLRGGEGSRIEHLGIVRVSHDLFGL
jgi:hypothetical protein